MLIPINSLLTVATQAIVASANATATATKAVMRKEYGPVRFDPSTIFTLSAGGNRIRGLIPADLSISIDNKWVPLFGSAQDSKILQVVDTGVQLFGGVSIQNNPIFQYKKYMGTEPLSIALNAQIIDVFDPLDGVLVPTFAALRMASPVKDAKTGLYTVPGPNPAALMFAEDRKKKENANKIDELKNYFATRPTRPVSLRLGYWFNIGNCYIENLKVTMSPSMSQGLPISSKISCVIKCAEPLSAAMFNFAAVADRLPQYTKPSW